MKLWGGDGRRVKKNKVRQPVRHSVDPVQDDFTIDWDAVWAKEEAERKAAEQKNRIKGKKRKKKYRWRKWVIMLLLLVGLYNIAVFSNIPFIAKWRTIYIETAMSTMEHQWLATAFIPGFVIDQVMSGRYNLDMEQSGLNSSWDLSNLPGAGKALPWESAQDHFFRIYPEIDEKSFNAYIDKHSDEVLDENGYLVIDKAGLKDDGTTIKTVHGDQVLAVDTVNGITIVKVTGEGFVGRLAIVKDPSRVGVGIAQQFGTKGMTMVKMTEYNDAVLGINASGFEDPNGTGNGGKAYGLVISNGKLKNSLIGKANKIIAFDKKDKLNIGQYDSLKQFRDGIEFKPALVINGKQAVKGSAGWGIQPRSAIGQTKSGEVLLLVVDGRAPGYSIGATLGECAEIMVRYNAQQACNLDGGSSSIMVYNGREISKPSAANKKNGRGLPNGFMVYRNAK